MNKRLLMSASAMVGAVALIGGATFASFNDTQVSQLPTLVSAGTLQLNQQGVTDPLNVSNMKPGDVKDFTIKLRNSGTLAGSLFAKINEIKGLEDGCDVHPGWNLDDMTESRVESAVDSNCANLFSGGDLEQYLKIQLVGTGGSAVDLPGEAAVWGAPVGSIASHATETVLLRVTFQDTGIPGGHFVVDPQNAAQGDSATVQLKFGLVQS